MAHPMAPIDSAAPAGSASAAMTPSVQAGARFER